MEYSPNNNAFSRLSNTRKYEYLLVHHLGFSSLCRHRFSLMSSSSFPKKHSYRRRPKATLLLSHIECKSSYLIHVGRPDHDDEDDKGNKDDNADDSSHQPEGDACPALAGTVFVSHRPSRKIYSQLVGRFWTHFTTVAS